MKKSFIHEYYVNRLTSENGTMGYLHMGKIAVDLMVYS